jgi:hypothetical protein
MEQKKGNSSKALKEFLDWAEGYLDFVFRKDPSKALRGGIAKDPAYTRKEVFFINGRAKNAPLAPKVPGVKFNKDTSLEEVSVKPQPFTLKRLLGLGETVGGLDTVDGRFSASEFHDQYLEGVDGGKESLVKQTQDNYIRDKEHLPWDMDPANRDKRVPVNIQDTYGGYYYPAFEEVIVGVSPGPLSNLKSAGVSDELEPSLHASLVQKNKNLSNGFPEGVNGLPFDSILGHEVSHAALFSKNIEKSKEERVEGELTPIRPYLYAIGEEYKVGALTFLNKSRQLTGKKFIDPQEIHQLLDEIEEDPSILDKNYSVEEARLPRTYLLLKETNPKGAELLRNAVARDCQYLANIGKSLSDQCKRVSSCSFDENISEDVVGAYSQLSRTESQSFPLIVKLNAKQLRPLDEWLELGGQTGKKIKKDEVEAPQIS